MKVSAAPILALLIASAAQAQPLAGATADAILDQASACVGGPSFAAIADRAAARGWGEISRREALKLQALPNDKAEIHAWAIPDAGGGPAWLLAEAPETPRPRAFSCELVFTGADRPSIEAALQGWDLGFGVLGPPTLAGPFGVGGAFSEFRPPEGTPWRTVSFTVEPPPRQGPQRSRIRFSGVEG